MRAAPLTLRQHLASAKRFVRHGFGRPALALLPHLAAFAIMLATERTVTAMTAFVLAWSILNFFWLALTRRPVISGALSLLMMTLLVLLSQLKYHVLMMTANFVDLMIVDTDTVSFLFMIFPVLRWIVALSLVVLVPLFVIAWRLDQLRMRRRVATRSSSFASAVSPRSRCSFRCSHSKRSTAATWSLHLPVRASTPLPN